MNQVTRPLHPVLLQGTGLSPTQCHPTLQSRMHGVVMLVTALDQCMCYSLESPHMDLTRTKWKELCCALEVSGDLAEKWWTCIHDSYQSTRRHYHTLTHISSMLSHLTEFKKRIRCYEEVSLAIYFHELVSTQSECVT